MMLNLSLASKWTIQCSRWVNERVSEWSSLAGTWLMTIVCEIASFDESEISRFPNFSQSKRSLRGKKKKKYAIYFRQKIYLAV